MMKLATHMSPTHNIEEIIKKGATMTIDGNENLSHAIVKLNVNLPELIAETAIWVKKSATVMDARFPKVRRAPSNLKRGQFDENGIRLDDNTYANSAIKNALRAYGKFKNFTVCHIWPKTCYDPRYHTALCNLILVPSALAGLTDHDNNVIQCIQYRAWELYGWHPDGTPPPSKPCNYPSNWKEPLQCMPKESKLKSRSKSKVEKIPLFIIPSEIEFRESIKKTKEALIHLYTTPDFTEKKTKTWKIKDFSETSSLSGNIRSRNFSRDGEIDGKKIYKIEVEAKIQKQAQ